MLANTIPTGPARAGLYPRTDTRQTEHSSGVNRPILTIANRGPLYGWSMELDRTSPTPLYRQVQEALIAHVHRRSLRPGDRVWSEHEITKLFHVARSVARQALVGLESQGVIVRDTTGSFLSQHARPDLLLSSAGGVYTDALREGKNVTSIVLTNEVCPAPESVARDLSIDVDTPCVHLIRVRLLDGAPLSYVHSWVQADRTPGLTDTDFSTGSLYQTLASNYGMHVNSAKRYVGADLATEKIAGHLQAEPGDPLLVVRSIGYDFEDSPIDTFTAWYRADHSEFVVTVDRHNTGGHVIARSPL